MAKLSDTQKKGAGFLVAYAAFIIAFWFLGKPHQMGPATAYFAVVLLHVVFAALAWGAATILKKD